MKRDRFQVFNIPHSVFIVYIIRMAWSLFLTHSISETELTVTKLHDLCVKMVAMRPSISHSVPFSPPSSLPFLPLLTLPISSFFSLSSHRHGHPLLHMWALTGRAPPPPIATYVKMSHVASIHFTPSGVHWHAGHHIRLWFTSWGPCAVKRHWKYTIKKYFVIWMLWGK